VFVVAALIGRAGLATALTGGSERR
jgi:hypothetical protein